MSMWKSIAVVGVAAVGGLAGLAMGSDEVAIGGFACAMIIAIWT